MDNTSRGELLAQQALGRNVRDIKAALAQVRVVLGMPGELARTRHGQIGLLTATNILGRLGALAPSLALDVPPSVAVLPHIPLLAAGQPLGQGLLDLARGLAGAAPPESCRLADNTRCYDLGLFVGRATADAAISLTIGADKWLAAVRTDSAAEPLNTADSNVLGIILAAAWGAAEVVKHLWLPIRSSSVAIEPVHGRMTVSAYDLSIDCPGAPNPPMPDRLELGHACLFGLGATGSGLLFALACLTGLRASLDLVDHDRIEVTNLERLFTAHTPQTDVGQFKAVHAKNFLTSAAKEVATFAYALRFEHFVDRARDRLGYVWCCLDSSSARRDLQLELPSIVCNGGTDGARWTLSTHEYGLPEHACLRDLYPPPSLQDLDPAKDLADRLGLDRRWVLQWRQSDQPLDPARLQAAAARRSDPAEKQAILAFGGLRYTQAIAQVCSMMRPHEAAPAATIGFVAIPPSIAMLSDWIKRRLYHWTPGPGDANLFQFDTLRLPAARRALTIRASAQCLCQTPRYKRALQTRQQMRQPTLERMFTAAAPVPQPPAQRIAARRRMMRHAGIGQNAPPPAGGPGRRVPGPGPPLAARPPLRGWRGVVCRIGAFLLGLLAGGVHLATLGALLVLLGLLVQWEKAGETWQPWSVVAIAWNGKMTLPRCLAQLAIYAGLLAGCVAAMLTSAPLFRSAVKLMRLPVPAFGYDRRRLTAHGLAVLYDVTGLAIMGAGVLSLWVAAASLSRDWIKCLPWWGLIVAIYFVLISALVTVAWPTRILTGLAARLQKWVLR